MNEQSDFVEKALKEVSIILVRLSAQFEMIFSWTRRLNEAMPAAPSIESNDDHGKLSQEMHSAFTPGGTSVNGRTQVP